MTAELDDFLVASDDHLDRIRELVEAYGAEAIFEDGGYSDEMLRDRMRLTAADILSSLQDGGLRIFRATSVEPDWTPSWLGRHWTTSLDHAYPHDGNGESYVVIEAVVDPDEIEIHRSVLLNMLSDDFSEAEILVRNDAVLEIVDIRSKAGFSVFEHLRGVRLPAIPEAGRPSDHSWRPPMAGKVFGG